MEIKFEHNQSAHCENGVVSNLMRYNGFEISEPMVFGIGSGLLYCYLPFLKINHAPAITYRIMPGLIFNRFARRVGIKIKREKFKKPSEAKLRLDENLQNNNPVGLQVGVFNLPYFPEEYRFHFNAHNLVVYGKNGGEYLVSDPVMESVTKLKSEELEKVRFAKGAFAPKGHIHYPTNFPKQLNLESAIVKGIKHTCKDMLAPIPILGVRGMRLVARKIKRWPKKYGVRKANHYLGQIVRFQEEIGTGGGGFRYIFAAFLQEASNILDNKKLYDLSKEMTEIGDLWRDFALDASRIYKNRKAKDESYEGVANQLMILSKKEEAFFKELRKAIVSISD